MILTTGHALKSTFERIFKPALFAASRFLKRHRNLRWLLLSLTACFITYKVADVLFPITLPHENDIFAQVVVDAQGRPLRVFPDKNGVWRYSISLDEVSPLYIEALLTYEDRRFWYHPGIDPVAIARAFATNLWHWDTVSGGSTISMQVARLLHPHSKTLSGKLYQMFRTLQLESRLSKKEILTLYCNIAPFGGTIEGVQAASYTYLNKPAKYLSHAESALLAVLPQSPTRFRPDLHPERAEKARNKVLDRMVDLNTWEPEVVQDAKLESVYTVANKAPLHAPLLSRRLSRNIEDNVIYSTVDGDLQRSIEAYVKEYVLRQPEKVSAAVLIAENATGNVKSYVGTADFGNLERFGHVDMIQATRSPGSTLKPFLYALALDDGLIHSQSLLNDTPQIWQHYRPGNFTGKFSGPVSATHALQRSLNIPAVALLDHFGPDKFYGSLFNAGLKMQLPQGDPSLAIILGGAGISLEELVKGYIAFANKGKTRNLNFVQNPQSASGQYYFFSESAAWIVHDILSGVGRPDGLRNIAALANKSQMAWKTGTSFGNRDTWAVGVDPNFTIGVWVGRPDGTPVPGATGRISAGPLLHAIADHLDFAKTELPRPANVTQQSICWPLGTLKSEQKPEHCHQSHSAWLIDDVAPPTWPDELKPNQSNPVVYWYDKSENRRASPLCENASLPIEQEAALWPTSLNPWLPNRWRQQNLLPPVAHNCAAASGNSIALKIESIENNTLYRAPSNQTHLPSITLKANGGEGRQHWYINGHFFRSVPSHLALNYQFQEKGQAQILVLDDFGNLDKVEVTLQ